MPKTDFLGAEAELFSDRVSVSSLACRVNLAEMFTRFLLMIEGQKINL
jgi:hypothetical protein